MEPPLFQSLEVARPAGKKGGSGRARTKDSGSEGANKAAHKAVTLIGNVQTDLHFSLLTHFSKACGVMNGPGQFLKGVHQPHHLLSGQGQHFVWDEQDLEGGAQPKQ